MNDPRRSDALAHEVLVDALDVSALHHVWGVTMGLDLSLSADHEIVSVAPGLGYTRRGAPVVVIDATTIGAPKPPEGASGSSSFDLMLARCAQLRWESAGASSTDAIPLGRATLAVGGTIASIDSSSRRVVRAARRPYIAGGMVSEPKWIDFAFGVRTTVDTSAAGFTATPTYVVGLAAAADLGDANIVGPFLAVAQPSPTQFHLELRFAAPPQKNVLPLAWANTAAYTLTWTGFE